MASCESSSSISSDQTSLFVIKNTEKKKQGFFSRLFSKKKNNTDDAESAVEDGPLETISHEDLLLTKWKSEESYQNILSFQQYNGSWEFTKSLMSEFNLTEKYVDTSIFNNSKLLGELKKELAITIFCTMLVLEYLKKFHSEKSNETNLLVNKSLHYLELNVLESKLYDQITSKIAQILSAKVLK